MSFRLSSRPWLLLLGALLLGACASTPQTRFYTLEIDAAAFAVDNFDKRVAVGPIDLPDYLDRPQIVTRIGDNRLRVDEFNRWGGRLDEDIDRVLQRGLGAALGRDRVFGYRSSIGGGSDYRVALQIVRFDGGPGGDVVLDVAWSVIDQATLDVVLNRRDRYAEAWAGTDYGAYAAVLGILLARLVDDIAPALRELAATTYKNPPASGG
jgi:uncharacterized protein